MKNIFTLLTVLFFISTSHSQENTSIETDLQENTSTEPEFKFDSETIDYGKIPRNSDGKRVFKFTNIGKSPLIISDVKASCGCTIPKKPTEPIMPGEEGNIEVSYNTSIPGGFIKRITISSNAKENRKIIRIKGLIVEEESKETELTKEKEILEKEVEKY
jgi:hypothetical protein